MKILSFTFICLIFNLFFGNFSYAVVTTGNPTLNFGKFIQSTGNSTITLDISGTLSNHSGIYNPQNTANSEATRFATSLTGWGGYEEITLRTADATYAGDTPAGCTVSLQNVASDANGTFQLKRKDGSVGWMQEQRDVKFSATLVLDGYCAEGTYSGKITVPYDSRECSLSLFGRSCEAASAHDAYVSVAFTVDTPLAVQETQEMNFGSIMSPSQNKMITLSYDGTLNSNGTLPTGNVNAARAGKFTVTGVQNRQVYITLPQSATIYSGSSSMEVTNFTSTSPITLTGGDVVSATGEFSIGATLNVNANQATGEYSGTYSITVSY